jgi:transposase
MRNTKTFKRTKQEKRLGLKKIAIQLYDRGFTTREIGKKLGRSHAWVALVVKEFEKARSGLKV